LRRRVNLTGGVGILNVRQPQYCPCIHAGSGHRSAICCGGWLAAAAVFAACGVIHAYTLTDAGVEGQVRWGAGPAFSFSYAGGAFFLLLCAWYARRQRVA
jgi:hypothetical protein